MPVKQARHTRAIPQIDDEQYLWSQEAQNCVQHHTQTLQQPTPEERADIVTSTIGQLCNQGWHIESLGRITATQFSAVIKCREPDYLEKRIMYPSKEAKSRALHYERIKEPVAVAALRRAHELEGRPSIGVRDWATRTFALQLPGGVA